MTSAGQLGPRAARGGIGGQYRAVSRLRRDRAARPVTRQIGQERIEPDQAGADLAPVAVAELPGRQLSQQRAKVAW